MYYKITKEQYKKYKDKLIKESYVGKQLYLAIILYFAIGLLSIIMIIAETAFVGGHNIQLFDIAYYLIMILLSILSIGLGSIQVMSFEKMLKEYIEMESKKK